MSCLGVHFALTTDEAAHLRALDDDEERLDQIQEVLEPRYFDEHPDHKAESDKAWDAMHRALAGGTLTWKKGPYPFTHVVLGGESLYSEEDYIISLKTIEQVRDIAAALPAIDEVEFRRRYFAIPARSYGMPLTEEDFGYTWDNFQDVRALFLRAASEGRPVLFTADQ